MEDCGRYRWVALLSASADKSLLYPNANVCEAFNGVDHCVAGSYPKTKRDVIPKPRAKHGIRWNLDIMEHYAAMAEVWTGKDDITLGGDGIMIP